MVSFTLRKNPGWKPMRAHYGLRYTLYKNSFNYSAYADSLLRKYILAIMPNIKIKSLPGLLLIEPDVRTVFDLEEHASFKRKLMTYSEGVEFCRSKDISVEIKDDPDVLTVLVIPRHGPGHIMHISR
jgi:hypothetical protein